MNQHFSSLKLIPVAMFAIIPSVAFADWVEIDPSEGRTFQMFYESPSIKRVGDISTIKILKNFKSPQFSIDPNKSYTFKSTTSIQEIKCAEFKYRNLEINMWSELNGTGKMEQSHNYAAKNYWGEIVKMTSIESVVISKACQKG